MAELPRLVEGHDAVVYQLFDNRRVEVIRTLAQVGGNGAETLQKLNELLEEHPLSHRILKPSSEELGWAVSRETNISEYRESRFVREMHGKGVVSDTLMGTLFSWSRRSALLVIHRAESQFSEEAIERFNIVIYAARTLCHRLAGQNVEREVHNFFTTQSGAGPVMAFSMKQDGGVMPVNYEAIRFVEAHWPADEAFRQIDDEDLRRILSRVESSWQDPLRARFQALELDLGAGPATFYVLPNATKQFYLFTVAQTRKQGEDRTRLVLTARQCEIMEWIAEGKTSWEVATILGISPRTVEKHMEAIFQRLNVENRVAAARCYLELKTGTDF